MRIIKVVDNLGFEFTTTIQESEFDGEKALISGIMLKEGVSRNGNLYTVSEMENIAKQAEGKPLEFGTVIGSRQGFVGKVKGNIHKKGEQIGKILKSWLDKTKRVIYFVAEVWGDLARKIRRGWNVSIDGTAIGEYVLEEGGTGRVLVRVKDLIFKKLQLMLPSQKGGVPSAKVHDVRKIEECSMEFHGGLSRRNIAAIIGTLIARGDINV